VHTLDGINVHGLGFLATAQRCDVFPPRTQQSSSGRRRCTIRRARTPLRATWSLRRSPSEVLNNWASAVLLTQPALGLRRN
jgi:hypothetical protein